MRKHAVLMTLAVLLAVASPSWGDPWKDESGKGRRGWGGPPPWAGRGGGETPWWGRGRGYWDGHFKHGNGPGPGGYPGGYGRFPGGYGGFPPDGGYYGGAPVYRGGYGGYPGYPVYGGGFPVYGGYPRQSFSFSSSAQSW